MSMGRRSLALRWAAPVVAALGVMLSFMAFGYFDAATVIGVVVVVVGVVGLVVAAPFWRMPAADRRAAVAGVVRAALVAVPFALITTLLGLMTVLVVEVPGSGLFTSVPAMMRDQTAVVVTAIGIAAGIAGFRRPTRLVISDWSRRHAVPAAMATRATVQLQRLRAFRTVPAMLGAAIGMSPWPAQNAALSLYGDRHPASRALQDAVSAANPLTLALLGYLLGVLLAEVTRKPFIDGGPGARLEARRPDQYLTPTARRLPAVLAAWVVVSMAAGTMAGRPQDWWLMLVAAAIPAGVAVAQRFIVRRAQPAVHEGALALDDTLRSSAAHALSGGASALLLGWALVSTRYAVGADPNDTSAAWLVLALVAMAGAYGLWVHYGSAHRGRRPDRSTSTDTPEAVMP
jgi:hypothetical protein